MKHSGAQLFATLRSQLRRSSPYALASWLVLGYALSCAFSVYAFGFDFPITGKHEFRQSQTALSALMMAKGGPWLAYETPLFGAPYAIPFEFPLYQWLAALLHLSGLPLDQAGRAVSITFFLLTLLPLFRLLRSFEFSRETSLLTMALVVSAPLYMFWTRAFMIESTALYFAMAALAVGSEDLRQESGRQRLGTMLPLASLAMLVKGTTGLVYLALLSLLLVERIVRDRERRAHAKRYGLFALCSVALPVLVGVAWTQCGEVLKGRNPLAASLLTSGVLHDWIYGTWQQKTSIATWLTFWDRTAWYGFGTSVTMAAGLCLAAFGSAQPTSFLACLLAVVGAFALFTNLHWFHDYYQYATTILVIIAVGFGLVAAERWSPRAHYLLPLFVAFGVYKSSAAYQAEYRLEQQAINLGVLEFGAYVQAHTDESSLIVVYGSDWSSVVPYYTKRRALMNRWNHPPSHPEVQGALAASAAQGNRLEAVLFCYNDREASDGRAEALLKHPPRCTRLTDCDVCL